MCADKPNMISYQSSEPILSDFVDCDANPPECEGPIIREVICRSNVAVVYLDNFGSLKCHFNAQACGTESIEYAAGAAFLRYRIATCLPSHLHEKGFRILGHELFAYFHGSRDQERGFKETNEYIKTKVAEGFHLHYWLSACSTLVVALASITLFGGFSRADTWPFLVGASSGAVGAFASVLQRAYHLEIDRYSSPKLIWIRGSSRIFVGIIFGVILVGLQQADFFLSFAKTNVYGVIVFSFLAGISERYVPELLKKIEDQEFKSSSEQHKQ